MKKSINKFLKCGPGGRGCICCFPAPGSRHRKLEFRRAKRKAHRQAFKDNQE